MNSVKAVKSLALGMGVLLLAGLGLLAYGLYSQAGKKAKTAAPVQTEAPVAVDGFGDLTLAEPPGARIAGVHLNGTMLAVIVRGQGPDRIVLVDMARGERIGTVHLGNGPVEPQVPGAE